MLKMDSTASTLIVAALVAVTIAYAASNLTTMANRGGSKSVVTTDNTPAPQGSGASEVWSASAPGKIEPWGGEIRISTEAAGKVEKVIVKQNDSVSKGDLLVLIDDRDARLRLRAAEAAEALRKRERDTGSVGRSVKEQRDIEDEFAEAERSLHLARMRLDQALLDRYAGNAKRAEVAEARLDIERAEDNLKKKREAWQEEKKKSDKLPTRTESALTAARTELSLAEQALERTRIRAPSDGTVLQIAGRVGETVAPNPQQPIAVIGDLSKLRVRAEVEERDISKIRIGQQIVVRSNSFPGKDFTGRVYRIAKSLGGSQLGPRGPRRPTDLDVLEAMIELDNTALLPGMRVDVFFKPDATAQRASNTRAN